MTWRIVEKSMAKIAAISLLIGAILFIADVLPPLDPKVISFALCYIAAIVIILMDDIMKRRSEENEDQGED